MMKLTQIGLIFGFLYFGFVPYCSSQVTKYEVQPSEAHDDIDIARHNKALLSLTKGSEQEKKETATTILKNPNYYNPIVIYALSSVLFEQGLKDEAMYWFYVAQLRARYDANLCLDASARQAVTILNQEFGPEINKYAFKDLNKLKNTVKKVVDFVRSNKEDYDHRWISLHGMGAVISGLEGDADEKKALIQPMTKWPEIKRKTLDDYYAGFLDAVKMMK
jgi:hypothetical protein